MIGLQKNQPNKEGMSVSHYIKKITTQRAQSVIEELKNTKGLPFEDLLGTFCLQNHLDEDKIVRRDRIFSLKTTVNAFLTQVISADPSCQATISRVAAQAAAQGGEISVNTAGYCKARQRLPEKLLPLLACKSANDLEKRIPADLLWRKKYPRKLVDGACISMPDTVKNQEAYPQPKTQKEGLGFPLARVVAVISLATGAVLDFAIAPYAGKGTGENALIRQLLHCFESGDIFLADCYYASFFLIGALIKKGVHIAIPKHASRNCDFRKGKRLGKKDHIVEWEKPARPEWMDEETYQSHPKYLNMRETKISSSKKGHRTKSRIIVTTFLDPKDVSKDELNELYDQRWFVEICFLAIKETMQMGVLRCKTPEMIFKEIWAHLLAYNLVRKIMVDAAIKYDKEITKLSFKLSLQCIIAFIPEDVFKSGNEVIYEKMLKAITSKKVGNRPGRSEPRAVKRRPKPFPRLQKPRQHYHQQVAA